MRQSMTSPRHKSKNLLINSLAQFRKLVLTQTRIVISIFLSIFNIRKVGMRVLTVVERLGLGFLFDLNPASAQSPRGSQLHFDGSRVDDGDDEYNEQNIYPYKANHPLLRVFHQYRHFLSRL